MIFMFSIQSHYGHPKLFIFSIQFTFVKLYSVFNSVFTKPRYKVFSMLFSMLFNFPQSIQYAMRYSGIVLYWHLNSKQAERLRSILEMKYNWMGSLIPPSPLSIFFTNVTFIREVTKSLCLNFYSNIGISHLFQPCLTYLVLYPRET